MKNFIKTFIITLIIVCMSATIVFAKDNSNSLVVDAIPFAEVVELNENNNIVSASTYDNLILLNLKDKTTIFAENSTDTTNYLTKHNLLLVPRTDAIEKTSGIAGWFSSIFGMLKGYAVLVGIFLIIFAILKLIFAIINKRRFKKFLKNEIPNFDNFINEQLRNNSENHNMPGAGSSFNPGFYNDANQKSYQNQSKKQGKDTVEKPKVTLKDVEGLDELKEDIYRIIDYLKNPQKYKEMGARAPKGVILYGPPGTGKTLIAKAIAGEAGVSFLNAVGSDFCEKYVGVGAQRVRELYKKARNSAPCIVFIDEVDAVAGKRDAEGNTEDERTTNALLAELDGFKGCDGVITICATNRLDLLDSAFQRAGRFDLKLAVNLPDAEGREKILRLHAKNKKIGKDINFKELSGKTIGFSGADLEALLNEGALLAASKNKKEISMEEINDAFFKIIMKGNKKKNKDVEQTKKIIAWHEAGHTLATKLLTDDSVPSVTIVGSTSGAGGVTFRTPKEMVLHSKKYLENLIKVMYAGRAAEEILLGSKEDITTGASQDIKQATNIIKEYIASYGMSNAGMLDLSQFTRDYESILEEAKDLALKFYDETLTTLQENVEVLKKIAETLYEKETLNEEEIDNIISNTNVLEEAVTE
jgi:cell division protease FtsH